MKNKLFIFLIFINFNLISKVSDFRRLVFILHNSSNNAKKFKKALKGIEKLKLPKETINYWLGVPGDDTDGVLHDAIEFDDPKILKRLLELGLDINDNSIRYGITPLNRATRWGHIKSAKFLIENGADIHMASRSGESPLESAVLNFDKEMTKLLIEKGAQVSPKYLLSIVEDKYLEKRRCNEEYYGINANKKEAEEFIEWLKKFLGKKQTNGMECND